MTDDSAPAEVTSATSRIYLSSISVRGDGRATGCRATLIFDSVSVLPGAGVWQTAQLAQAIKGRTINRRITKQSFMAIPFLSHKSLLMPDNSILRCILLESNLNMNASYLVLTTRKILSE